MSENNDYQLGFITKALEDLTQTIDGHNSKIDKLSFDMEQVKDQISMAKTAIWVIKWTFTSLLAVVLFFIGPFDAIYKWLQKFFTEQ